MSERKYYRPVVRGASALGALAFALSPAACGGSRPEYLKPEISLEAGSILPGTNLRHEAGVNSDSGLNASNRCATTDTEIVFAAQDGYKAEGRDANGTWIGLRTASNPELPDSCNDDSDGVVWVVKSQLKGGDFKLKKA